MGETEKAEFRDSKEWLDLEHRLMDLVTEQKPARLRILQGIFNSVVKLARESPGTLNLKISATVLKELRFSFKMFAPYRYSPKITMFGSARVARDSQLYKFAKEFAAKAVDRKYMIITGGGPGIMAAGNEGASFDAGFGLNIRLPLEQTANSFIDQSKKLFNYKYFFTRKLFLVKEAAAFVFFPGGWGTLDEAFEVLTLLQTGKMNLIPVVLLEPKGFGYWTRFTKFLHDVAHDHGFISEGDERLFRIFHNIDEALDHLDLFYHVFHSLRYVRDGLVIRLKRPVSQEFIKKMNAQFPGLTSYGKIISTIALPEENNEPELVDMFRLFFPFDKREFGDLRQLIDFINESRV